MAAKHPGFSPGGTPTQTTNAPWSLAKDTGFQGFPGFMPVMAGLCGFGISLIGKVGSFF